MWKIIIDTFEGDEILIDRKFKSRAEAYKYLIKNRDKLPRGIVRILKSI